MNLMVFIANVCYILLGDIVSDKVGNDLLTGLTEKQAAILAEIRNNPKYKNPSDCSEAALIKDCYR